MTYKIKNKKVKEERYKITSGKGHKKYYEKYFGSDVQVMKVAQDQYTGAEMSILKTKVGKPYILVYSSGDYGRYDTFEEAENQFNKLVRNNDLI